MKLMNIARYISVYPTRIYRLFSVKQRPEIVWKELIRLHKEQEWLFGQYDNIKLLRTTFVDENNAALQFDYQIIDDELVFSAVLTSNFSEENINDIMILASHLNNLLKYGVVKVNIENAYVEFIYSGHLLVYMLFSGEIHRDLARHYKIASDCIWAYTHMLSSGDEPVFVIAELMKRYEKANEEQ